MSGINLFAPKAQGTTSITSGVVSARVALTKPAAAMVIRVKNIDTTDIAYINFGDSTVVATVPAGATPGSMPIGPGETGGFSVPEGTTHVAAICTAGTPIVYFTPGNGV
jgi:hypothetical protein